MKIKKIEHIERLKDFFPKENYKKQICRYLSIEKYEWMLRDKAIYFASAEQFIHNDDHEGAITEDEYNKRKLSLESTSKNEAELKRSLKHLENAFKPLREFTKISCWHINDEENFAMWNYYSGENKGVALITTPKSLLKSLDAYKIKPNYGFETIRYGNVKYIDYETDKMESKFGFLTPFLHKRKHYEYENEFRLIVSTRVAHEYGVDTPKGGVNVNLDINKGISKLILSPNSTEEDIKSLGEMNKKYGVELPIELSKMKKTPKY